MTTHVAHNQEAAFPDFEDFHLAPPALEVVDYILDRVHNRVALETFWLVPVQGLARFLLATIDYMSEFCLIALWRKWQETG
jgi:hypothetical protein